MICQISWLFINRINPVIRITGKNYATDYNDNDQSYTDKNTPKATFTWFFIFLIFNLIVRIIFYTFFITCIILNTKVIINLLIKNLLLILILWLIRANQSILGFIIIIVSIWTLIWITYHCLCIYKLWIIILDFIRLTMVF